MPYTHNVSCLWSLCVDVVSSRLADSNDAVEFDLMSSIFTLPAMLKKAFPAQPAANRGVKTKLSLIGRKNRPSAIPRSVVMNGDSLMTSSEVYVQPACLCSKCTARRSYGLRGIHRKRRRRSSAEQLAPPSQAGLLAWKLFSIAFNAVSVTGFVEMLFSVQLVGSMRRRSYPA